MDSQQAYFVAEINCWSEWLIFSDIFFFLMKSGCIDFVDFVDKLVARLTEGDQHILRTNHVTWLFAEIIRVELVVNALNADSRKVGFELSIGFGSLFFLLYFSFSLFFCHTILFLINICSPGLFLLLGEVFHIMLSELCLRKQRDKFT